jgi:hypothetical protein
MRQRTFKVETIGGEYEGAEWFDQRSLDTVYGVYKTTSGEWLVLKRVLLDNFKLYTTRLAQVDSREAAIGILKLLKE